jgi:ArsR family transcriptional regulator
MLSRAEQTDLESYIQGMDVQRLTQAFEALGEPNRCLIFRGLLKKRALNVGEIAEIIGISESLASQHLKVLLHADMVTKERKGKNVYYLVNSDDPLVKALKKVVKG